MVSEWWVFICVFQFVVGFWFVRDSGSVLWTFLAFGAVGRVHLKFCLGFLRSCGDVGWKRFVNK